MGTAIPRFNYVSPSQNRPVVVSRSGAAMQRSGMKPVFVYPPYPVAHAQSPPAGVNPKPQPVGLLKTAAKIALGVVGLFAIYRFLTANHTSTPDTAEETGQPGLKTPTA